MKHHFLLAIVLSHFVNANAQFSTVTELGYSKNVGDSFEIYISLPESYNLTDSYNVFYYCDANLKSGKRLRGLLATNHYKDLTNAIFVGIGHSGKNRVLRRRDFILPYINGPDTAGRNKNYGQSEKFYAYLKNELVPYINTRFKTNKHNNSIAGHSLGGLFVFFCLFKSDSLFSKYFALSPSLWVHKYAIYDFNKLQRRSEHRKYLYFSAGSKEKINKILNGANKARRFLDSRQYGNLTYEYDTWDRKTHNSAVPLALDKILREKL